MQNKKGFTLIELILVTAIIGVLATLVGIRIIGPQKAARDTRRKSDIKQYQTALEIYANDNGGLYPTETTPVHPNTLCGASQPLGGIACSQDPREGSTYTYRYETDGAGLNYVIWAFMEKPALVTNNEWFVVCTSGESGILVQNELNDTNGSCPL